MAERPFTTVERRAAPSGAAFRQSATHQRAIIMVIFALSVGHTHPRYGLAKRA